MSDTVHTVGAVVINWNAEDDLHRCIAALTAKDVPFTQIVVIDNYHSSAPRVLQFPFAGTVQYVRLPYNAGFARANNLALEMIEDCEWVALVNPDAFLEIDWLRRMLEVATHILSFQVLPVNLSCSTISRRSMAQAIFIISAV